VARTLFSSYSNTRSTTTVARGRRVSPSRLRMRNSTSSRSSCSDIRHLAPDTGEQQLRTLLGSFLFSGEQLDQPAGTLSGGEKTRLALAGLGSSAANVLLLDEPTNNLDPASREQVLSALRSYTGAVVLVTHDPGAVDALEPERVIVLPDGTEDHWSDEYRELV